MSVQKSIVLEESEAAFLDKYALLGFRSEHELVMEALHLLQAKSEQAEALIESATLYTDLYEQDAETREWNQAALANWPDHD